MTRHPTRLLLAALALALPAPVLWAGPAEAIAGHPPVAADDQFVAVAGEDLTVTAPGVLANDHDVDGGSFSVGTVSAASAGDLTMKTNGGFTYHPAVGFVGDVTFTYRAIDTTGLQSAEVTVVAANQAPVGVADSYSTVSGVPLVVPVGTGLLANDTDPDGDALVVNDLDTADHGTVSVTAWDGSFTYTPVAGFVGTDTFAYEVGDPDGAHSGWVTVTITVLAASLPPVADPTDPGPTDPGPTNPGPATPGPSSPVPVGLDLGAVPAGAAGTTVPVLAHVRTDTGPGSGASVQLSLGRSRFTGTTDASGDAVIWVRLPERAGHYLLTGLTGALSAQQPLVVGTVVTGRVRLARTVHRGDRAVLRGRIGSTRARLAVTLVGPGPAKRTFAARTSKTGRLVLRLPARATARAGRYQVVVRLVPDARQFAERSWTRTFRSIG